MSHILQRVRHARGYKAYARNDDLADHKAVASWLAVDGNWYCVCGHPVTVVRYSAIDGKVIR